MNDKNNMMTPEKLAIDGGEPVVKKKFTWPVFDDSDIQAVTQVLQQGKWGNPDCTGLVEEFENAFAKFCGVNYAVTCVNGSVALRLALISLGVKPGDEIIVPPYTFIATATAVLETNCVPVFVDIAPDTYNIDPQKIEAAITPKTKGIIPVHFAGQACDMEKICNIAQKHNLFIIEDTAHAHGSTYQGKKLGSIGQVGTFSFQSSKNLTAGEGGIAITNDEQLYHMMRSLRNVGRVQGGQWYDHHYLGCNYRITEIQAALLLSQLKRLEEQTNKRDANARYLDSLLSEIDGISPLFSHTEQEVHSSHIFIFKYDKQYFAGIPKKEFTEKLAAEGVPCFMGYPFPIYKQPLFQEKNFMCYAIPDYVDYKRVYCPVAEKACSDEGVWILQAAMLGERKDMDDFATAILKIQNNC